jgi:hypothetical protein
VQRCSRWQSSYRWLYQAITSKRCLSRQRSRVRVSSSPPFLFRHLQNGLQPTSGTKRGQKGISSRVVRLSLAPMRSAFARQFPRRFGDALCYSSVLLPTIGSTTTSGPSFRRSRITLPCCMSSFSLGLSYRILSALDGARAFSWKEAEKLSSANSGTQDHVCNCRGKAVTANRWR